MTRRKSGAFKAPWLWTCLFVVSLLPREGLAQPARVGSTLELRSDAVAQGRVSMDPDGNPVVRARYRMGLETGAAGLLAALALEFGWSDRDLAVVRTDQVGNSRHVLLQQQVSGVPVWNRYVRVSLDSADRVSMVVSGYDPQLETVTLDTTPTLDAQQAADAARRAAASPGALHTVPELVVVPGPDPRLAWRMVVWPQDGLSEIEVVLDAHSGEVLSVWDATVRSGKAPAGNAGGGGRATDADPHPVRLLPGTAPVAVTSDGTGNVFDPDPLATSGSGYTAPYVDNNDADSPELTAELKRVTLRDITQGSDGLFRLEGPYVRIVGTNSGGVSIYTPPAEPSPEFNYTRSQSGFEAVNAYHHIDRNQRYLQSLGFTDLQSQSPLPVNPAGTSSDDSGWLASQRYLFFGTGGVDDGEDAAVVLHEYAHALLEAGAPGLRTALEGQALHEGWADYWAMSYQRGQMEAGLLARSDWQEVFRWDSGIGTVWPGRRLDFTGRYPEATCSDNGSAGCSVHNDGRLWGTVMMQIYGDLGKETTDRLNLLSHRYLAPGVTFPDAAQAVIQADIDHYDGAHVEALIQRFAGFGLVDPTSFGPVVSHDPLLSGEEVTGSRTVLARARGIGSNVVSVTLHHRPGSGGAFSQLDLTSSSADTYQGELPLPGMPATINYFFSAKDAAGRETLLPAGAPSRVYSFEVGPDTIAPAIVHTPLADVSLADWPPEVQAVVTDNLGVGRVAVQYTLSDGATPRAGAFELVSVGGTYIGEFDAPVSQIAIGTTVSYSVRAVDTSQAENEGISGPYTFRVSGTGALLVVDADDESSNVTLSGGFSAGIPSFGTRVAHSGNRVWATDPAGPYPSSATAATLTLPEMNLAGTESPKLVFWHWYDTEHDGRADPGQTGGEILWDGGNVKLSLDGGLTWVLLTPVGGYPGTVISGPDNPLSGQPAFGGFSFAWRREIIGLPAQPSVLVRFEFGTDASNTEVGESFAGWMLDDIQMLTEVPFGPQAPVVTAQPDPVITAPSGKPLPPLGIQVADDTGIADVWIEYVMERADGSESGSRRMAQSPLSLAAFSAQLGFERTPMPGDELLWRARIRDLDGNEVLSPAAGQSAFRVSLRLTDSRSLLDAAQGSGSWNVSGSGWAATGPDMGALISAPISIAANGDAALSLTHSYRFGSGSGGLVQLTTDDGKTWTAIAPEGGYPGQVAGTAAFTGSGPTSTSQFDLSAYRGLVIRLRLKDQGTGLPSNTWSVATMALQQETAQPVFELPTDIVLHANFPDPFATATNVSYSIPESATVHLALYDMLGRRVRVIDQGLRPAGNHTTVLTADGLASGIYVLRLDTGSAVLVEMLTVAR